MPLIFNRAVVFVFLAATVMMAAVAQDAQAQWRSYKNARFGFEFVYPENLFSPGPKPANDDGRTFETANGEANITASASLNVLDQTPRTYLDWIKRQSDIVDNVTYQKVKKNWVVISGFKGHMIYYNKTIFSCGGRVTNSIELYYPLASEKTYNRLVGEISKSLTPGIGYGSPNGCAG